MDLSNDYDEDGNNIVPCPICLNVHCPSKEGGKCPEEDEYANHMTLQQKFNEYIASGDIAISDEQRDFILPFIERCVGEERAKFKEVASGDGTAEQLLLKIWMFLTQEDKIK